MGLLRIVLAFAVLNSHVQLFHFLDGGVAVEVFYLISGFLISYILSKRTAYRDPLRFYLNRALKIYPIYYAVVAVAIATHYAVHLGLPDFSQLPPRTAVLITFTNLSVFGQDLMMFLQQRSNGIAFTADFRQSSHPLWIFLIVPPAWSLSLELVFYFIAPFVLKRRTLLITVMLASFCAKMIAWLCGLRADPWSYRFFFFEIWIFLLGALSEQICLPVFRRFFREQWHLWILLVLSLSAIFAAAFMSADQMFLRTTLLVFMAAMLPALFLFQQDGRRKWDVRLGDLSYPLYLCHYLVVVSLMVIWPHIIVDAHDFHKELACAIALVLAAFLEIAVARPIERYRMRLRNSAAPIDKGLELVGDEVADRKSATRSTRSEI